MVPSAMGLTGRRARAGAARRECQIMGRHTAVCSNLVVMLLILDDLIDGKQIGPTAQEYENRHRNRQRCYKSIGKGKIIVKMNLCLPIRSIDFYYPEFQAANVRIFRDKSKICFLEPTWSNLWTFSHDLIPLFNQNRAITMSHNEFLRIRSYEERYSKCKMDNGNIAPENLGEQKPNQYNKRVKTSSSNNKDVRRPTKMPAIDHPTGEKETSRRSIWWIVTQATQKSRHRRSGHTSICKNEV